jgi:dihydroorotate dehydrogenase electron transfer subunit
MLSIPDLFLRRPFSIFDVKKDTVSFLYRVVGEGTRILSEIKNGEIQILGPLGKGYAVKNSKLKSLGRNILIAGGTGIASLHFLAKKLKTKPVLFFGAKTKKDLLLLKEFKVLSSKIFVSTEDGSKGHKGFITEILEGNINFKDKIYICGPSAMEKAVIKIAKNMGVGGEVSVEEKMACGLGLCQGCVIKISDKNKMTCKDGPVFNINEIEI